TEFCSEGSGDCEEEHDLGNDRLNGFYDFVGFGKCVDTHGRQYQALDASSQETDTISVGACAQFCHNSYMASGDFSVGFEIEVTDSEGKLCRCLVSAFPDEADELERRLTESEDVPHTGSARELFYGTHDESDPPVSADGVSFLFLISLVLTYTNTHHADNQVTHLVYNHLRESGS
ncbi:hypothetical protein THAOC_29903, partial [Thalassiosira oceanica]